jgi:hypothetical protein
MEGRAEEGREGLRVWLSGRVVPGILKDIDLIARTAKEEKLKKHIILLAGAQYPRMKFTNRIAYKTLHEPTSSCTSNSSNIHTSQLKHYL